MRRHDKTALHAAPNENYVEVARVLLENIAVGYAKTE